MNRLFTIAPAILLLLFSQVIALLVAPACRHAGAATIPAAPSAAPFRPVNRLDLDTGSQNQRFAATFQEVQNWVGKKAFPGAVLAIGQHGKLVAWKAFGRMASSPDAPPMPKNAVFDLASLTKVTGTTTAAGILYDRKLLDLDAPVVHYIPEFAGVPGHDEILVRNLLSHSSGLSSPGLLWTQAHDRAGIMSLVYKLPMNFKPGEKMQYRDYNMILMGEIVQRLTCE